MPIVSSGPKISRGIDSGIIPTVAPVSAADAVRGVDKAVLTGRTAANNLMDDVILRPAERARDVATANDQESLARANIELRPQASRVIAAQNRNAEADADPDGVLADHQAQLRALTMDKQELEDEFLKEKELSEDMTRSVKEREASARKMKTIESKAAKVAGDIYTYTTRLKVLVSKSVVAENARKRAEIEANTGVTTAGTAGADARIAAARAAAIEIQAPKLVEADAAELQRKRDAAVAAVPLGAREDATALNNAELAKTQSEVDLPSGVGLMPVIRSTKEANAAREKLAADQALELQRQGGPKPVSQEVLDRAIQVGAETRGTTGTNFNEPLNEDTVRSNIVRVNRENAKASLQALRTQAMQSENLLSTVQQVKGIVDTGVSTGALYGPRIVQFADGLLAMLGNEGSELRAELNSKNNALIPLARAGQAGATSDLEYAAYQRSNPFAGNTPKTNAALVAGLMAMTQRNIDKPVVMERLIGEFTEGEAERIWQEYVRKNSTLIKESDGTMGINKHRLTPSQWLDVTEQRVPVMAIAPKSPAEIADLPLGSVVSGQVIGKPEYPFVRVGDAAVPNASYWE